MVVVIKYRCNFDYPHTFGGRISIVTHRKEVINFSDVNLDGLTNDMRSEFIYRIQQMFNNYGDKFSLDEIRLFNDYSEVK